MAKPLHPVSLALLREDARYLQGIYALPLPSNLQDVIPVVISASTATVVYEARKFLRERFPADASRVATKHFRSEARARHSVKLVHRREPELVVPLLERLIAENRTAFFPPDRPLWTDIFRTDLYVWTYRGRMVSNSLTGQLGLGLPFEDRDDATSGPQSVFDYSIEMGRLIGTLLGDEPPQAVRPCWVAALRPVQFQDWDTLSEEFFVNAFPGLRGGVAALASAILVNVNVANELYTETCDQCLGPILKIKIQTLLTAIASLASILDSSGDVLPTAAVSEIRSSIPKLEPGYDRVRNVLVHYNVFKRDTLDLGVHHLDALANFFLGISALELYQEIDESLIRIGAVLNDWCEVIPGHSPGRWDVPPP